MLKLDNNQLIPCRKHKPKCAQGACYGRDAYRLVKHKYEAWSIDDTLLCMCRSPQCTWPLGWNHMSVGGAASCKTHLLVHGDRRGFRSTYSNLSSHLKFWWASNKLFPRVNYNFSLLGEGLVQKNIKICIYISPIIVISHKNSLIYSTWNLLYDIYTLKKQ